MVFSRKQDPTAATRNGPVSEPRRSEKSVIAHAAHAASTVSDSVIGNDLSIEGETITIRCKGTLRVNGDIEADLHSKELEVGREGTIKGTISAETVNVFGRVNGAILGGRVILHSTAAVDGDIHSGALAIESGACFDGRSRKVTDLNEIRPQLEKTMPNGEAAPPEIHAAPAAGHGSEQQTFGERAANDPPLHS